VHPGFDPLTSAWLGALIVLFLNTAAYSGEIFYGALRTIPKGDIEAADAYGFSGWTRFRRIVWPTMLRLAWPATPTRRSSSSTPRRWFSSRASRPGSRRAMRSITPNFRRQDLQPLRALPDPRVLFHPVHAGDRRGLRPDQPPPQPPPAFEINLMHQADLLKAADDAWLFKLLVKGLARKWGFAASFMAKPYEDYAGNGMHVHFSVLDAKGDNIFDDGSRKGSDVLRQAVAGCLAAMPGSGLLFAPHGNSYDRLVPGAHAPTGICWAYENRTSAIRIPGGNPKARRIEHRVAGGDINPYLVLAGVLGAALVGIEDEMTPPEPITGNAYALDLPQMPMQWGDAIEAFERDATVARIFEPDLIRNLLLTKRQEMRDLEELSPEERVELYLDTV
jgi:hypothetical protein